MESHIRTVLHVLIAAAIGWLYLQMWATTVELARMSERLAAIEALMLRDSKDRSVLLEKMDNVLTDHERRLNHLENVTERYKEKQYERQKGPDSR